MRLYLESVILYFESIFSYFESILLHFESAFLDVEVYFCTSQAYSCTLPQCLGKEKVVMNVFFTNANLRAVGDPTYAYFTLYHDESP